MLLSLYLYAVGAYTVYRASNKTITEEDQQEYSPKELTIGVAAVSLLWPVVVPLVALVRLCQKWMKDDDETT